MNRALRGVGLAWGLLTLAACLTPPPPAEVAKPVAVAPAPPFVPDDPKSCLDIEALPGLDQDREVVTREVERSVLELSEPLRACSALKSAEELDVAIEVDGAGKTLAAVVGATVAECSLVDCVRKQLSGLDVAGVRAGRTVTVRRVLRLDPSAPVVFADRGDRIALAGAAPETAAACFAKADETGLPPSVIREVVRAQYGRFRACYEAGLGRSPSLRGSITTRFVIAADGKVSSAVVGGNELPDCQVARCVRDAFLAIQFPPLENGNFVTVQYPIMLEPG